MIVVWWKPFQFVHVSCLSALTTVRAEERRIVVCVPLEFGRNQLYVFRHREKFRVWVRRLWLQCASNTAPYDQ